MADQSSGYRRFDYRRAGLSLLYPKANDAGDAVLSESIGSGLPGESDGPQDAYRHMLLGAELTRLYGRNVAGRILWINEKIGTSKGQSAESREMDEHNNDVALSIGEEAETWDDVKRKVREQIERAQHSDTGEMRGSRWRPPASWGEDPRRPKQTPNWRQIDWSRRGDRGPDYEYALGGADQKWRAPRPSQVPNRQDNAPSLLELPLDGFPTTNERASELMQKPDSKLTREDVDALMTHGAYWRKSHPASAEIRRKVTGWFERLGGEVPK